MRSAAATVAERGADLIDLNMGCPVPKVCKTGAGAALIKDPDTAVEVARAAREGSGLPVTVKLRSGQRPGETDGYALAHRLVHEAGVARSASTRDRRPVHHKGVPDYDLAARARREPRRARDPHRRAARARRGPGRLRAHRRRRGHARPRLARQPVAVREPAGRRRGRADRRRGPRRARLGHGPRRRAPRPRARGALPAQVLPLVPGPDRRRRRRCSRPSSDALRWTRRGPFSRASGTCRERRSRALYCPLCIAHRAVVSPAPSGVFCRRRATETRPPWHETSSSPPKGSSG